MKGYLRLRNEREMCSKLLGFEEKWLRNEREICPATLGLSEGGRGRNERCVAACIEYVRRELGLVALICVSHIECCDANWVFCNAPKRRATQIVSIFLR